MTTCIVDAHLHVWEMPSERFPWSPLRNMRPAAPASVELLLETMQTHGVGKAIIVQPSNYGYDHSYVLDCLARFPGRFGAVALLPFREADAAQRLAELARAGVPSVRLFLRGETDTSWVDDGSLDPLLSQAPTGTIICVFGSWDTMPRVHNLAARHRRLCFVIDHLGHPDVERPESWQPVLRLADLAHTYIKVSDVPTLSRQAYPFADVHPLVLEVYAAFGAKRMMWASNFPHILRQAGYGPALRLVDEALPGLADPDRARVMGGTAAELWGLEDSP